MAETGAFARECQRKRREGGSAFLGKNGEGEQNQRRPRLVPIVEKQRSQTEGRGHQFRRADHRSSGVGVDGEKREQHRGNERGARRYFDGQQEAIEEQHHRRAQRQADGME